MTHKSPSGAVALASCPFCGGAAVMEEIPCTFGARFSVGCSADEADCMGYQTLQSFSRRGDAAKAWNTRAPSTDASVGVREAVARIIDPSGFDPHNLAYEPFYIDLWKRRALEKADEILAALAALPTQGGVATYTSNAICEAVADVLRSDLDDVFPVYDDQTYAGLTDQEYERFALRVFAHLEGARLAAPVVAELKSPPHEDSETKSDGGGE